MGWHHPPFSASTKPWHQHRGMDAPLLLLHSSLSAQQSWGQAGLRLIAAEGGQSPVSGHIHVPKNPRYTPWASWGIGGFTGRMLGCGSKDGKGGGGPCWGAWSSSGPTKMEMLNGLFPEGKV